MNTTLCYLPLTEAQLPSPEELRLAYAEVWPDLSPLPVAEPMEEGLSMDLGPLQASITLVSSALAQQPPDSPMWPTASQDWAGHTAHLAVRLRGARPEVERATLLTQLCTALLACVPALGIYWTDADLAVESSVFTDVAQGCDGDIPLTLWIRFQVAEDGEGSNGRTRGLEALGHYELEAPYSPEPAEELYDRLYGVAAYLLAKGPVIRDGDTLGETEDEYIRARLTARAIQLVYED